MKYNSESWPFKWFGYWKEYDARFERYPSVYDFVDVSRNAEYNKSLLVKYLWEGVIVVATSKTNFPSPFNGEIGRGTVAFRTDGEFMWFDNIIEFIENEGLLIPESWYRKIKERNFIMPRVTQEQIENLEHPNLSER